MDTNLLTGVSWKKDDVMYYRAPIRVQQRLTGTDDTYEANVARTVSQMWSKHGPDEAD